VDALGSKLDAKMSQNNKLALDHAKDTDKLMIAAIKVSRQAIAYFA
jgi:hypothetical protein